MVVDGRAVVVAADSSAVVQPPPAPSRGGRELNGTLLCHRVLFTRNRGGKTK